MEEGDRIISYKNDAILELLVAIFATLRGRINPEQNRDRVRKSNP